MAQLSFMVTGKVGVAIVAAAWAALDEMPEEECLTSALALYLAILLRDQGDVERAETLCKDVVKDCTQLLGPQHTHTLKAKMNLANFLSEKEMHGEDLL